MKKVITYGTYDLLHYGHIRLLKRAKELGDYLIVGVTADDFDMKRGKINVQQSLIERIEAVHATGIADEIIVEEYEGQKIDDIRRYNVDIFTVGSDWVGKFDYLKEYCEVVYLERTKGVSSSGLREKKRHLNIGIVGESKYLRKIARESEYVNGIIVNAICTSRSGLLDNISSDIELVTDNYTDLLEHVDAVYIHSDPHIHYKQVLQALKAGKHVLCETPIALDREQCDELFAVARDNNCVLMEALKTAYVTAYERLLLLLKGGIIGKVISVDTTCTSLSDLERQFLGELPTSWNSMYLWGPTALLPIFHILGTKFKKKQIVSLFLDDKKRNDLFTKIELVFDSAVASAKVGIGVKSEGEMIVSGTNGYLYVPAPWWKTEYFEVRFEDAARNKRYFYQLTGEGIRQELVQFARTVDGSPTVQYIERDISRAITGIMEDFSGGIDTITINGR